MKTTEKPQEIKLIEYKTFDFEIKEAGTDKADEYGRFKGYASTFNNVDQGYDIVDPGAFAVTIKQNKGRFPILADHAWENHIGYNEDAKEDLIGLLVDGSVNLKVQKGVEKFALAKQALELQTRMGLSIGYTTIQSKLDNADPKIRHLSELKLWEYSFVTFPMNVEAMVTAAKSLGAVDKANFLLHQLKQQGITVADLELALRIEAARVDEDPAKICQSLDNIIENFKN